MSTKKAILVTLGTNALSVLIEYLTIVQVYNAEPRLREPKGPSPADPMSDAVEQCPSRNPTNIAHGAFTLYGIFKFYCQHVVFLPSFALALLYLTVLSFSGQMVTYLISAGYNSMHIGLVRTLSVIFELSVTWIAPRLMKRFIPVRVGMWFLSWQVLWLGIAVCYFWTEPVTIKAASGLAAGTILSRIGLWGYDLCASLIIQEAVQGSYRGAFSSTEASIQNAFEMLSYVSTIVWSRPDQFRYPALLSAVAVFISHFLFAKFLRRKRGHLVHTPKCMQRQQRASRNEPTS